ncbi:serine/threonine-protein kinase [Nonomuraea sp. NPDC046802]|uniref:serine/threonine-protein kinase n=1 Tax=Nonomuraea sp. NPDC046802 TaxID=3154919 RepID=UPI0033DB60A5
MTPYASPTVAGLSDQDPRELGQYRVAGRLGEGGMGSVYLAEGPTGLVAIKLIKPHLAHDPEFMHRFRREVAAARKVSRWCTAPVLDAQLDDTPLWLVTEYVPGLDLGRHVKEHGPLTGAAGESLAVGVAVALAAIHQAGIVHRDLKPGNVLLSPLGPRVIDFGISRALDTEQTTRSGQMMGTPGYMAPELFSGQVDPAADIFAWGCVVGAATSATAPGRSPFAADNMMRAFHRVMQEEPDLDGVEPALRDLVRAALARDPAARPTAEELVAKLSGPGTEAAEIARTLRLRVGYGETVALPPAPAAPPSRRLRDLATGAGVGVVAVGLVAAAVAGVRALPPAAPESTDVLYEERFAGEKSGWDNSGFTSPTSSRGYTGDGRYTMAEDFSNNSRWATAPVNAVLPDQALVSVKMDLSQSKDSWNGVFCEYSKTDDSKDDLIYLLEVRENGYAKIVRAAAAGWTDLTPDLRIPGFDQKNTLLRAECVRGGGEVRVALWAGEELIAERVDHEAATATGQPRFGLYMEAGKDSKSRVFYDDFAISRLP